MTWLNWIGLEYGKAQNELLEARIRTAVMGMWHIKGRCYFITGVMGLGSYRWVELVQLCLAL